MTLNMWMHFAGLNAISFAIACLTLAGVLGWVIQQQDIYFGSDPLKKTLSKGIHEVLLAATGIKVHEHPEGRAHFEAQPNKPCSNRVAVQG